MRASSGTVLGIADVISFHGETVHELREAFHAALDHYIADCEATGRAPLKPVSGKLMLRISPETHAAAAVAAEAAEAAEAAGKSLNRWAPTFSQRPRENRPSRMTSGWRSSDTRNSY